MSLTGYEVTVSEGCNDSGSKSSKSGKKSKTSEKAGSSSKSSKSSKKGKSPKSAAFPSTYSMNSLGSSLGDVVQNSGIRTFSVLSKYLYLLVGIACFNL